MEVIKIHLKESIRNKRFILFTILVPVIWFISLKASNSKYSSDQYDWVAIDFVMTSSVGVLSNSLVTFGKQISNTKKFYLLQSKTSKYSIWLHMRDSLIIQLILNALIIAAMTTIALLTNSIHIDWKYFITITLISIFGIYISIIGFALGVVFNHKLLDSAGLSLIFLIAFLMTPFYGISSAHSIELLTNVQKLLPGFYIVRIVNHLALNLKLGMDPLWLFTTFLITVIPFIFLIWKNYFK